MNPVLETTRLMADDAWLFVSYTGAGPRHKAVVPSREVEALVDGHPDQKVWEKAAFDLCLPPETFYALLLAQLRERPPLKPWTPKVRIVFDPEPQEKRWEREAQAEVDAICTALQEPR